MTVWPVPLSFTRTLPTGGCQGAFWENRLDRFHAGIDLYAPPKSEVLAAEDGEVVRVSVFTSPELIPYWNITYAVLVRLADGTVCRYAEMGETCVQPGERVRAGRPIGRVGLVLNAARVNETSPLYIQKLAAGSLPSMLHFELHRDIPEDGPDYLGGNYFNGARPSSLLDPTPYLATAL